MYQWDFATEIMQRLFIGLERSGADVDEIVRRVGLDPAALGGERTILRLPENDSDQLLKVCAEVTGDPNIGLSLGQAMPAFGGLALEYLFLSSENFGAAMQRFTRYCRLLSSSFSSQLLPPANGRVRLEFGYNLPGSVSLRHSTELTAVCLVRFFRHVTFGEFQLASVGFVHTDACGAQQREAFFGVPAVLGQASNYIEFEQSVCAVRCMHAEPKVQALHESLMEKQLRTLKKRDLVIRVEAIIADLLESGEVNLEGVAARVGISPARLRQDLADVGAGFSQLVSGYRISLAKELLLDSALGIEEIVYRTGFSEPSPFYRAFKRSTGMTPVAFRERYARAAESQGG
ncbi:helix-turn-helix domain-containing protein [Biformimicrobium ophioploci]|uniref:AraC family transcriptional regulator n=1 Tax=Biformimicrobium ophioploci TaxID=3036711 RepID=A0ABQ6M2M7_9GAMM|nr:AraC family transcriptional regulator [Microbulbifer sp. NKW57]GMG88601.1 AraC family transcriptional regulator [Microbulbifer sp. NKW57]